MNLKVLLIELHQKPIVFYPIYRQITGSLTSAILLAQLLYWWSACRGKKFYKTDMEIMTETQLTVNELRGAKVKLKKLDFVKITKEGLPAKTFYELDLSILLTKISENHTNKFSEFPHDKFSEFHSTTPYIQESTTESNTLKENFKFSGESHETVKSTKSPKKKTQKKVAAKKSWTPKYFDAWRKFYKAKFGTVYAQGGKTGRGKDAGSFTQIRNKLIQTFKDRQNRTPDEIELINAFEWLLGEGYKDEWIRNGRFEPSMLNSKYNGIVAKSTGQAKRQNHLDEMAEMQAIIDESIRIGKQENS